MHDFRYVSKKEAAPVKAELLEIIHEVQDIVRDDFTFQYVEVSGIGKKAHHGNRYQRAEEKIRYATAEASPCPVAVFSYKRLHDHAHERRQNPEKAEAVGVSSQGGKYSADIRTLEGIGYLNSEESEAYIPQLPEGKFVFLHFMRVWITVFNLNTSLRI